MLKPLTVWITTNWKILKEMGIPDYLTCLLRNLYASQEATIRTRHGKTDWFKIGKEVHQGCVLSHCLFNLYAEYIMFKHIDVPKNNSALNTSRHILNLGLYNITYTSASLTRLKPLNVQTTTNWKILKEMGILDHLSCLLQNLYAGQEAMVRTQHWTDWFKIRKGVCQGCILSPCLFNLYA